MAKANGKADLLLETWTSSVTLKTPDVTKLSWNSGPSVETKQQSNTCVSVR